MLVRGAGVPWPLSQSYLRRRRGCGGLPDVAGEAVRDPECFGTLEKVKSSLMCHTRPIAGCFGALRRCGAVAGVQRFPIFSYPGKSHRTCSSRRYNTCATSSGPSNPCQPPAETGGEAPSNGATAPTVLADGSFALPDSFPLHRTGAGGDRTTLRRRACGFELAPAPDRREPPRSRRRARRVPRKTHEQAWYPSPMGRDLGRPDRWCLLGCAARFALRSLPVVWCTGMRTHRNT